MIKAGFYLKRGSDILASKLYPPRVRIWVISTVTAPNKHKSCKSCSSRTRPSVTATMIAGCALTLPFQLNWIKKIAKKKGLGAIICLGAVIRGATPHFDYVSAEVSKGIAQVSLESEVPIIFGVLTTDTIEQAIERAGTKAGNKGWSAAMAAVEMANLLEVVG